MKHIIFADAGGGVFVVTWLVIAVIACFIAIQIKRRVTPGIFGFIFDKMQGKETSALPVTPSTQIIPGKCPQCGAELKPDVSEGLCPACLLQRGIATEGGVPPGTPPFVPPTIPDLARLFPQLEILELIGKGGMGAVYKARQPALDRFVALKILAPRSGGDLDFTGRFTREARALAKLSHPNIVAVYDFGQADRLSYFIMEFVDGPNLRQIEQAGRLTPREALEIIPQICTALQFAHDEGIVHRDIKPENVLLDKKGRVKIADFGLAKILGTEPNDFRLTGARDVVGTPHYMAPEQVEKPQAVDHRADIYSLGVVFYEMLTGELPLGKFQPPSSCARGMQIDVRLDEVVLRSLEKQPERRYQQASQVKTAVETIAQTEKSEIRNPKSEMAPRFSRTAIAGACWLALFFFVALRWTRVLIFHSILAMPQPSSLSLLLLGLFGAMILGWIAVSQIRRSAGKLYGMGLAVFDGLLFPLLALDGLIAGMAFFAMKSLAANEPHNAIPGLPFVSPWTTFWWIPLLALLVVIVADFLIIWLVWRAVNQSIGAPAPPIQKPDRFWRRFAVVMACALLIPGAIAIVGLLAAIAIPNFVKARNQALANRQKQAAAVQQSNVASNPVFGPVIERTINLAGARTNFLITFKTGNLRTPPPETAGSSQAIYDWARREGVDAGAGIIGNNVLSGFDLTVLPAPARCWEELTPVQAASRLDFESPNSFKIMLYGTASLPDTCVFQTHEGGIGILQVTAYVSDPPGLKVRYKFLDKAPETQSLPAATEPWSPMLWPGEKPDPRKVLDEARKLAATDHYEEALQRYLWYYKHAREFSDGASINYALSDWAELGRRYPKAKQALIEVRDHAMREFQEGRGYGELFTEVSALNRELQDEDATLALFKSIQRQDKQLAGQCYYFVEDLLMQHGEYELCLACIGDPQARFESYRRGLELQRESQQRIEEMRKQYPGPVLRLPGGALKPPDLGQMATNNFVGQVCKLVEILVATGHKTDAEKIRDQAMNVLDDARLKSAVSDAEENVKGVKTLPQPTPTKAWHTRVEQLRQRLEQNPQAGIPELKFLTEYDWLEAAKDELKTDADYRRALNRLRVAGETHFVDSQLQPALKIYVEVNHGQFPTNLAQLQPFFQPPVDEAILQRYEIVPHEKVPDADWGGDWVVTQKSPVDKDYDRRLVVGAEGGWGRIPF